MRIVEAGGVPIDAGLSCVAAVDGMEDFSPTLVTFFPRFSFYGNLALFLDIKTDGFRYSLNEIS